MAFRTKLYGSSTVAAAALTLVLGASAQATHNYSPQAEIWEECQVRIGNIIRLDRACVERNAQSLGLAQPPLGLSRPPESDLPGRDFVAPSVEPDVATGTDQDGDQDTGQDQQAGQDTEQASQDTGDQETGQDQQASQDQTGVQDTGPDQQAGQDQNQTSGRNDQPGVQNGNGNGGNPGLGNPGNDPLGPGPDAFPTGPGEDVGGAGEAPGPLTQEDFGNDEDGEPGVRGRSDADNGPGNSGVAGVNADGRGR